MKTVLREIRMMFVSCVNHLPLVSGLPECKPDHYVEAVKEVIVNLILSTSPLWLGSLITFSIDTTTPKTISGYRAVFTQNLQNGATLIYATAAISPMFYFSLVRTKTERDFPSRLSHNVFGLLIFMVCTALFGVQQSGVKIDPNFVLPSSIIIYLAAIFMIFIATVYRNWRDTSDEFIKAAENQPRVAENDFVQRALSHRP
jgi:hypothetical protein